MNVARSRNIKPGFYNNEDLASCSLWARYIFPGLWMLADREGRLEDRAMKIKAQLLPYDAVSHQDVDSMLDELSSVGLLDRYEVDGTGYLQVVSFLKHQNPHYREKESSIPIAKKPEAFDLSRGDPEKGTNTKPEAFAPSSNGKPEATTPTVERIPECPGLPSYPRAKATLIPDSLNLMPDASSPDEEKKECSVVGITTPQWAGPEKGNWCAVIDLWNSSGTPVPVEQPHISFTSDMDRRNADRFADWWKETAERDAIDGPWDMRAGKFLSAAMEQPTIFGKPRDQVNFGFFFRDEVWKSVLQLQSAGEHDDGNGGLPLI